MLKACCSAGHCLISACADCENAMILQILLRNLHMSKNYESSMAQQNKIMIYQYFIGFLAHR